MIHLFFQAGESPLSWAVSNFGKKANNSEFEDFEGCTFANEDVITGMVDFSGTNVSFTFAKNGETLGEAFSVPKSQLEGKALFPHVSCRNVKIEVNFGKNKDESAKENFFPLLDGYTMAANCLDSAQRSVPRYELSYCLLSKQFLTQLVMKLVTLNYYCVPHKVFHLPPPL